MSRSPDLSAFPIPRKGSARPIAAAEEMEPIPNAAQGTPVPTRRPQPSQQPTPQPISPIAGPANQTTLSGQVVATTVKLDESRYLRLMQAGQPGPGRLKRRTIQEMMVEAIDEWFSRRGL